MFYDWSYKGSTYSAVVPLTNLFGLYQIPEPEPGQLLIIPINLVLFQWCLIFDTKLKTSLPVIWLENIDTKNPGWFVRNEHTRWPNWSWLIRLKMKMLKNSSTDWSSKRLTMRSKENGRISSLILIESIITLLYIGFGNIFNVITD